MKNATIRSTHLGRESHGIWTVYLELDFGNGIRQSFGGWNLGSDSHPHPERLGRWIVGILDTLRCESWEKLVHTSVRVEGNDERLHRLGHFVEDRWFDAKEMSA